MHQTFCVPDVRNKMSLNDPHHPPHFIASSPKFSLKAITIRKLRLNGMVAYIYRFYPHFRCFSGMATAS